MRPPHGGAPLDTSPKSCSEAACDGDRLRDRRARAEARVRALHRQLVETGHELEALRRRTQGAEEREKRANEQLAELSARLHHAELAAFGAEQLRARLLKAEMAVARLEQRAGVAEHLLAATRESWSWRLSLPVRVASKGGRAMLRRTLLLAQRPSASVAPPLDDAPAPGTDRI